MAGGMDYPKLDSDSLWNFCVLLASYGILAAGLPTDK